jgi:hypothetical protein
MQRIEIYINIPENHQRINQQDQQLQLKQQRWQLQQQEALKKSI